MIYLIQATFYTAILYMVYLLFLKNRTDHNWSRAYLLMNITLPFVLPLISMPIFEQKDTAIAKIMLPVVTVTSQVSAKADSFEILPIIYIALSSILLGYFIAQAVQIALFIKRHKFESLGKVKLIRNSAMGPGSWFGYVFIPTTEADTAILQHEEAHVRHKHSYDIVLIRLLQCVAWPNIALWFIAKELKTVHEFQADAVAGNNKEVYGTTLLNELFHTKHFSLSHTFFHHPIKRRIMMLQKNKSHAGKLKVVTLSLLLVTGMLYVQCTKGSESSDSGKKVTVASEKKALEYDVAPEFDGSLSEYLIANIKYPKEAEAKKLEGRVIVQFTIDEEGTVTNINVRKSPDEILSQAAIDVIANMPKWKPGMKDGKPVKVQLTQPIRYDLADDKTPVNKTSYAPSPILNSNISFSAKMDPISEVS